MTYFILGLITGCFFATTISLWTHQKHKQAWQAEYRRLMGGIDGAMIALSGPDDPRDKIGRSFKILSATYNNDPS